MLVNYKITVEVPLLLCYFTFLLLGNVIINLYMYKVCYNVLDYPETNCSRLGRYTDNATLELEKIVQPYAGTMTAVAEMLPGTIPVLLALYIGSWSDKYGRRPVLLYMICCMTLSCAINAILVFFKEINPWFLILSTIPIILCGGVSSFFSVVLSCLNDVSTPETRAMRMTSFDIITIFATFTGGLCSSYILYATSYSAMYGIGVLIIGSSAVYTYFFIPETLQNRSDKKQNSSLFTWNNITDIFSVLSKKRESNKRLTICLLIVAITFLNFIASGEGIVRTLYLRGTFGWTLTERNIFAAWSNVVYIVATMLGTYVIHNKFKVREVLIVIASIVSSVGVEILYIVAQSNAYLYASVAVGLLSGLANPMLKTMLTKLIAPNEMGKIFSVLMVLNSLCMLISALLYTQVYNSTVSDNPGMFNYISIGLYGITMIIVIIVTTQEFLKPIEERKVKIDNTEEKITTGSD